MSPTILVVDDEEFLREAIGFDYEMRNFRVLLAANGREAFEIVTKEKVDIILSDVRMPNGDGLELLDRVKAFAPAIPVIFISGYADLTLEEAYARGAAAVFPKPFDRKALALTVEAALQEGAGRYARKTPRVPADLAGGIRLRRDGATVEGRIKNLGRGGMFVEVADGLPPCAEEIDFRLALPASGTQIAGTGVVRWVRAQADGAFPAGFGIEFSELEPASASMVVELVNESKTKAFIPRS